MNHETILLVCQVYLTGQSTIFPFGVQVVEQHVFDVTFFAQQLQLLGVVNINVAGGA